MIFSINSLPRRLFMMVVVVVLAMSASAQTTVTQFNHKGSKFDSREGSPKTETNKVGNYVQQAAAEDRIVVYSHARTIDLTRPYDAFHAYIRWFDYATDYRMNGLSTVNPVNGDTHYNGNWGDIQTRTSGTTDSNFTASYVYDGGGTKYVGCDQSAYTDFTAGATFTEPTLSQRLIYEIHPASQMAHMVDVAKNAGVFLEEYDLIAPAGRTIYIGPKYPFYEFSKSSFTTYPSYYFNESAPVWMNHNNTPFTESTQSYGTDWEATSAERNVTETSSYVCTTAYATGAEQTNSWTATSGAMNNASGTVGAWNYSRTRKGSSQLTTAWSNNAIRLGSTSSSNNREEVVFTTSAFKDYVITKVEVVAGSSNTNTNRRYTCTVNVGGENFLNAEALDASSKTLTASPNKKGDIKITFSPQNGSYALYIKSIKVTYAPGYGIGEEVTVEPTQNQDKWAKVITKTATVDEKKVTIETTGKWNWKEDGTSKTPSIQSGQFMSVTSSAKDVVYELTYTAGATKTTTTTRTNTVTTKTRYAYEGDSFSKELPNPEKTSTPGEASTPAETTVPAKGEFKIAKFTVHYKEDAEVGPAEIGNTYTDLLIGTKVLARQDFNFGATGLSDSGDGARYNKTLEANESAFGFFYNTDNHVGVNDENRTPSYNEYSFINNGIAWQQSGKVAGLANHLDNAANAGLAYPIGMRTSTSTSASTGYALYTDGSMKPGVVFSLKFNAELCPGAKMFFSAYVGEKEQTGQAHAILDFIVVGVDAQGNETALTTYTTGELRNCGSNWRRILFAIDFNTQIDFDHFRLRVVNKANNTTANDFFIDDITVYLRPAPFEPIQATSPDDCLTEDSPLTMYAKLDFGQVLQNESAGSTTFYYRWIAKNIMQGQTATEDDYVNTKYLGMEGETGTYGMIVVPNTFKNSVPAGYSTEYTSFSEFDRQNNTALDPSIVFIKEGGPQIGSDKNTNRYMAYIATPMTKNGGSYSDYYTCVVSQDPNDLTGGGTCANMNGTPVGFGVNIHSSLGGTVAGLEKVVCANYSYDLTYRVSYAILKGTTETDVVTSAYVAHWLWGDADQVDGMPDLYGATFEEIEDAIQKYSKNKASEDQQKLVTRLVQKGLLTLGKVVKRDGKVDESLSDITYVVMPIEGLESLSYTAFPVAAVRTDAPNCELPQTITLTFPKSSNPENDPERNVISFVKDWDEEVPNFVSSRPRRVRVPHSSSNGNRVNSQDVKVRLSNPGNAYRIESLLLYSSNDEAFADKKNQEVGVTATGNPEVVKGEDCFVSFNGLDNLNEGKTYTFKMIYRLDATENQQEVIDNACKDPDKPNEVHAGEAFITFIVVPDLIHFVGTKDASWNDDYNWEEEIAPLKETSVVYNTGNHILLNPTESTVQERANSNESNLVDKNALPYITYDINYQPYTSRRIHVPAGTALAGQQNIHSTDAWSFDMKVVPNQWNMTSIPMEGVYTGDIFLPEEAPDESKVSAPFEVKEIKQTPGTEARDRNIYTVYNSMYNSEVFQKDPSGDIEITSSTWSYASNALGTPLTPGMGWSLGLDVTDPSKDYVIRLPKADDVYHYYRNDVWTGYEEDLRDKRGDNYGQPAFKGDMTLKLVNNSSSQIFLLGNPTFAHLDLQKLFDENADKLTGTFYLSGLQNKDRYNHVTSQYTNDTWLTNANLDGSDATTIAPMEAVLVMAKNAGNELELSITKEMLVTSEGKNEWTAEEPAGAPSRVAAAPRKMIHIAATASNFCSTALLVENTSADNAAVESEDAEVFLLDKGKTPFAIYTIASNKSLAINQINDAEIVPLAMYAQKDIASEVVSFTGDDLYLSEWDLVDNKTNTRWELSDGFKSTLQMQNDGSVRYYLEHARHYAPSVEDSDDQNHTIHTYNHDGMLTVFSADDMIDFRLYDAAGRLIAAQKNAGRQQDFSLVRGVYVVRANGNTAKVVVK